MKHLTEGRSQPARAVWIEILSCISFGGCITSQPARAVWIEIAMMELGPITKLSQPARAVWIEILHGAVRIPYIQSQPARAVWIEIPIDPVLFAGRGCHSLRGLCGLKYWFSP